MDYGIVYLLANPVIQELLLIEIYDETYPFED